MPSQFLILYAQVALGRLAAAGRRGEAGQSMVEYGIMLALVAVAAMVAVQALGAGVAGVFTRILGKIAGIG